MVFVFYIGFTCYLCNPVVVTNQKVYKVLFACYIMVNPIDRMGSVREVYPLWECMGAGRNTRSPTIEPPPQGCIGHQEGVMFNSTINARNVQEAIEKYDLEQIPGIAELFLGLEGIVDPTKITVTLRNATTTFGIPETKLRGYIASKHFLAGVKMVGGYNQVEKDDKMTFLTNLSAYFAQKLPKDVSITHGVKNEPIDDCPDVINSTFLAEHRAAVGKKIDFERRYADKFASR